MLAHIDNRDGGNRSLTGGIASGIGLKLSPTEELTDGYKKSLALGLMTAMVDRQLHHDDMQMLYHMFIWEMDTPYSIDSHMDNPFSPGPGEDWM